MSPYRCIYCNTALEQGELDKHSCPGKTKAREEREKLKPRPMDKIPIPIQIREVSLLAVSNHSDGLMKAQAIQQLKDIRDYINKVLEVNNIK